jgi:hypothetical protein
MAFGGSLGASIGALHGLKGEGGGIGERGRKVSLSRLVTDRGPDVTSHAHATRQYLAM